MAVSISSSFRIASLYSSHKKLLGPVPQSRSPSPSGADILTLRALVSTKEAGIIIGKGGKNVADLREQTGVKAGVTKVIPGVHERVLTVGGSVESVAKVRISHTALNFVLKWTYSGIRAHRLSTGFRCPHDTYLSQPFHAVILYSLAHLP